MVSDRRNLRMLISQESDLYAGAGEHAINTAKRRVSSSHPAPKVIAISGGKGGVGKTLLAANLSYACATLGCRTLVIDGDLGLSNLDVVMNLRPSGSIDDVLSGECSLRSVLMPYAPGLDLLPASSGFLKVPELAQLHKMILLEQIEELDGLYDLIVIDSAAGVSKTVQHWAASAGQIIIVVTPEPTSLADGYATMKILADTVGESSFSLVVNMAASENESLDIFGKFSTVAEEFLGAHVRYLGHIPIDPHVRSSVRQRSLLCRHFPFSAASVAINALAAQISMNSDMSRAKGTSQFFWRRMINCSHGDVLV